ncbi:hypothetical protein BC629DRAFT_384203 [Irpex lacteus]|nr:hypothetical protein BC629DRAFT_384203 [Irpex lacteus]
MYHWYYNNYGRAAPDGKTASKCLPLVKTKTAKLQDCHAYLQLHGPRVKAVIVKHWEELQKKGGPEASVARIKFYNDTARALLSEETQEVQTEVRAYRDKCNDRTSKEENEIVRGIKEKQV